MNEAPEICFPNFRKVPFELFVLLDVTFDALENLSYYLIP